MVVFTPLGPAVLSSAGRRSVAGSGRLGRTEPPPVLKEPAARGQTFQPEHAADPAVPDLAELPRQPRPDLVSLNFFTVPTARLRVLFVLVVLAHYRRRVLHFNVTEHPTAAWTAQPIVDAFPDDPAPSSLLRDRDRIDGHPFPRGTRRPPGSIQRIPTPSTAPKRGGSRLKRARYISDERRIVGSGQDQIV